jgi:catechol 2,3-dioxygenase-like lactoylglutathione lyase family enzyme
MARPSVRFLYSGIRTTDLERSVKFYRALGFRVRSKGRMKHGGRYVHLVFPGSRHWIELNYYPKGNRFYEPVRAGTEFDHFGFYAPNVERWYRRALKAGGRPELDFIDGQFRLVYVNDPNGVCLEAFGPAAPPRTKRKKRGG